MKHCMHLSFLMCAALAAPSATALADVGEPERNLARQVVAAFKAVDPAALAELVDFEQRFADRLAFGTATRAWADMDDLARLVEQHGTMKRWIDDNAGFNRYATLTDLVELDDPDAGRGAVPDRRILRMSTFNQLDGRSRELLLVVTPELKLIDMVQGEPFFPGNNPQGEAGLLPEPRMKPELSRDVTWPDDVLDFEREGLHELRAKLLALPDGPERDLVIEQLHRDPRAAVAALMEELVWQDGQPEPDAETEVLLGQVLTHITGRPSKLRVAPELGVDEAVWRASNHRAVDDWLRWHNSNGLDFIATEIEDPIDPTIEEKSGRTAPLQLSRWEEKLREQTDPDAGAGSAPPTGGAPPPPPPAGTPPPPPPGPAPGTGSSSGAAPSPVTKPAVAPQPKLTKRDILFPAAADLSFRFGDRDVVGRDVERKLPASLKAALNDWAEPAAKNGLKVIVSGNPEAIVIGLAPDDVLAQCARWMDDTWSLLDESIPLLDGRDRVATVALIVDLEGSRSDAWSSLLDALVGKRLLFASDADAMREDMHGLLRRNVPFFIQPTWDVAGNAAAGDDEFRLANEVAHKTAQCLLTARAGEQPPMILWGLGEVAEISLFGTVYQFNSAGFVATGDHFDWPRRTRYWLEKSAKKHRLSLGKLAATASEAGQPKESQMATWAVLAWLRDKQPATLSNLLLELADLHAAADPRRRATVYRGADEDTLALLQARLDALDSGDLIHWLDALD